MKPSIPFTYLIGWSSQCAFYYGVRYAQQCRPEELWKTYFTSSKHVKKFRELHGEPDVIIIRRIFESVHLARQWENKVLRRMRAKSNPRFLNKTDNLSPPSTLGYKFSEEQLRQHSIRNSGAGNGMYAKKHREESKLQMSITKNTRPLTPQMRQNYSNAKSGENHPNWNKPQKPHVIAAMLEKVIGVPKTEAHRQKLSEKATGTKHWNNGVVAKRFRGDPPDDTWKPGRLKK